MINVKNKSKITILSVLAILSLSTIIPALAFAAPLANNGVDWDYSNGNSWAQNYSPQTQINNNNVGDLEVKWLFPIGTASLAPAGMRSLSLGEGVNVPPIVHDGVVYVISNSLRTYAIDANNGKLKWTYDYDIDVDDVNNRLPLIVQAPHLHGTRYWEGGNAILQGGIACDFYGINADSGELSFWIKDICANVPGNMYDYQSGLGGNALNNVGTYDKGNQFIFVLPGAMHSGGFVGDARHVTLGIDMDSHEVLWRVFSYPPHGVTTKDWALQECEIGFFQTYPCTDVAESNQAALEWDWAFPNEVPSKWGGVTANWGQPAIDEDTGILYTQTGNQGPYTNLTLTPGPRLYGSTIMAIDMESGQRIWWLQPFPHDPYDYDCNWSGILAEVSGLGKVYMKGCKEGLLYVMDAATGKPYYSRDVLDEAVSYGQITSLAAKEPSEGGIKYHLTDPFSFYDLREWNFPEFQGKYCGSPCLNLPSPLNGIFATDMSYDPEGQTLYHYTNALAWKFGTMPMIEGMQLMSSDSVYAIAPANASLVARDVLTGDVKWTWFYDFSVQRSHMVVSGDMVFTGFTDGKVRFFDKDNGDLLNTISLGSGMVTGPTIGKDSNGNSKIFILAGSTSIVGAYGGAAAGNLGPSVPGTLIALGLNEKAADTAQTTTVTTTAVNTVTAEGDSEGMSPTITYAAVVVAVIAVIAAAVLFTRKTK